MDDSYRLRKLQELVRAKDEARASARRRAKARTQDVEADLSFLTLFTRALLDILVENEVCTLEEVGERMRALDLLDGEADHGLDAKIVADELGVEKPEIDERKRFAESVRKSKRGKRR